MLIVIDNTQDEVQRRSFVTNEENKSKEDDDDDLNDRDLEAPVENIASPNRLAGHYGDIGKRKSFIILLNFCL